MEHSLRALRVKYAEATGNPLDAAVVPTAGGSDVPAGATSSGHQQDLDASGAKVGWAGLGGWRAVQKAARGKREVSPVVSV